VSRWSDTFNPVGHQGEDIFAPRGTAIVAVDDGQARNTTDPKGGNVVYLVSPDGDTTYYAHLDSWEIPGGAQGAGAVKAGDTIGYVGSTGNAAGKDPHLHFEWHPQGGKAQGPAAALQAAALPSPRAGKIAPIPTAYGSPALLAKAILNAWSAANWPSAAPEPGIAYAVAQALMEGTLSAMNKGTNNVGSMHAVQAWADAHARDLGYGMIAMLDSGARGYYIARMMVHPSLQIGAGAFLAATMRNVDLRAVTSTADYCLWQYVAGYFTMGHAPVTPIAQRKAAAAAGTLTDADKQNIAEYAAAVDRNMPGARAAIAGASSEPRDPAAITVGPPFASLAERLHSTDIAKARQLLGSAADHPPAGAISLAEALAAPGGDGVWLFPIAAPVPKPAPKPIPRTVPSSGTTRSSAVAWGLLALGAAALGGVAYASERAPRRQAA
jgi:hypothetical protein